MRPRREDRDTYRVGVIDPPDFTDPGFVADPYPWFAEARRVAPMIWHEPTGQWLAVTYEAANSLLRSRSMGRLWHDRERAEPLSAFNTLHRNQMMENEPPDHTRLRSLVAAAFARGHIERLRPRVTELANGLLDRVDGAAGFDVLADYAEPLPVAVIAELLGVPEEDQRLLRPWSAAIVKMYEYSRAEGTETAAVAASGEFMAYMRELAAERRARPREDLVSHLAQAAEDGRRLTDDEVVASAILLLNAGHEASVNALGNGFVALVRSPGQVERMRADPGLAEPAVEEMIRFDAPLQLFERTAKTETVIGGVTLAPGDKAAALLGAANRDPAAFADADVLDIGRRPNNHIGFGAGIHHCIGAPLARMELQISMPLLFQRFPRLSLTGEPVRRPTFVLRGYESVTVSV
jgi:cytochrome P450